MNFHTKMIQQQNQCSKKSNTSYGVDKQTRTEEERISGIDKTHRYKGHRILHFAYEVDSQNQKSH